MKNQEKTKLLRKNRFCSLPLVFAIVLLFAVSNFVTGQELSAALVSSSGDSFVAAGQTLEFAIGEIAVETYQSNENMLGQGFFQAADIATGIQEDSAPEMQVTVFPNPVSEQLQVCAAETPVKISLFSLQGEELFREENPLQNTAIEVRSLMQGIYVLCIVYKENLVRKKIIKN